MGTRRLAGARWAYGRVGVPAHGRGDGGGASRGWWTLSGTGPLCPLRPLRPFKVGRAATCSSLIRADADLSRV
jgi:hypothetical protein